MTVRAVTESEQLPAVLAASRALAALAVEWSQPERQGRPALRSAAAQLATSHAALGVSCFRIDEDTEWCAAWLETLGVGNARPGVCPRGAGSLLWLAAGHLIAFEVGGCSLTADEIVARTWGLWG